MLKSLRCLGGGSSGLARAVSAGPATLWIPPTVGSPTSENSPSPSPAGAGHSFTFGSRVPRTQSHSQSLAMLMMSAPQFPDAWDPDAPGSAGSIAGGAGGVGARPHSAGSSHGTGSRKLSRRSVSTTRNSEEASVSPPGSGSPGDASPKSAASRQQLLAKAQRVVLVSRMLAGPSKSASAPGGPVRPTST